MPARVIAHPEHRLYEVRAGADGDSAHGRDNALIRRLRFFAAIEPDLERYPAVDPPSFRRAMEETVARFGSC